MRLYAKVISFVFHTEISGYNKVSFWLFKINTALIHCTEPETLDTCTDSGISTVALATATSLQEQRNVHTSGYVNATWWARNDSSGRSGAESGVPREAGGGRAPLGAAAGTDLPWLPGSASAGEARPARRRGPRPSCPASRRRPARLREVADEKIDRSSTSAGAHHGPGDRRRAVARRRATNPARPPASRPREYRTYRPEFAILKREQWDIYFRTLRPLGHSTARGNRCGAERNTSRKMHRCKQIRTLTRNPFVTAAVIRHFNPHTEMYRQSTDLFGTSCRSQIVYGFEAIKLRFFIVRSTWYKIFVIKLSVI